MASLASHQSKIDFSSTPEATWLLAAGFQIVIFKGREMYSSPRQWLGRTRISIIYGKDRLKEYCMMSVSRKSMQIYGKRMHWPRAGKSVIKTIEIISSKSNFSELPIPQARVSLKNWMTIICIETRSSRHPLHTSQHSGHLCHWQTIGALLCS